MRTARSGTGPRVALARAALAAALALLAAAAAWLVAAWTRGERTLVRLDRRTAAAREALADALRARHGIDFYAPLDERFPADLLSGHPLLGTAAVRVPGVFGSARRFDGRTGENLVAMKQRWSPYAANGFALAFWARFPEGAADAERRLVWDRSETAGFGVRLAGGRLEASFGDATGIRVLSAPAPEPGRFAHVAIVLAPDRAALFLDGSERDACAVSGGLALRPHFVSFGTDGHFPAAFDADEWCVWFRPPAAADVARLAAARVPLPELLEPRLARRLRRREAKAAAFRSLLGVLGALRPSRSAPALFNRTVPVLDLRMSGADRRHFRKAQAEALASGFRTRTGARSRRVQASFGGRSERVRAWLDETVPSGTDVARPAFVLAAEGGLFGDGSGLVRLFPPEQFGARRPDAARPIPLDPSVLVRLHVDGDFLGLYCLVPFEGPAPPWFATGARDVERPDRIHFSAPAGDPASGAGLSGPERDAAWDRMLALLRTDPSFPLGPAESGALARRHIAARETLLLPEPEPGPEPLLGGNPAAFYVTDDLDLAAAGPDVAWQSSDPAAISPEGRVSRPEDGRPRVVALTASSPGLPDRTYRFRVMPEKPAIPALFLSFGRPLDKLSRTDFVCFRVPAGDDGDAGWISGTGAGGGGAKLRGNTSYVSGRRRSMTLKFDAPVRFPGAEAPVRHLYLLSGYSDATRLRNALCFDVFRAMSPEGTVRAVPVSWTEVFVNGAYAGVWECCPRLQDAATEEFSALYKVRTPEGLWASPGESAEAVDRVGAVAEGTADPYAPFRDLARSVAEADRPAFAAAAPETFDLDELADFFLLVNFTGNEDGRVANQFAGRRAPDGRWILLPWDYDKTFLVAPAGPLARRGRLVSPLFSRLLDDVPGFRERLAPRWRELRAGPLSEASLDAWIDGRAAVLAPFMDEDYRVVPPLSGDRDYASAVAALRAEVRFRLGLMDEWFAK